MIPFTTFSRDKALVKSAPRRVYGTLGDGALQKRVAASLCEWALPPEARDFNFEVLDGDSSSVAAVLASANSLPFLSDFRVVHVRRAEKLDGLGKAGDGATETKKAKAKASPAKTLADGLKNLPASTVLIFSRTPEVPEPGARATTPRCLHASVDKAIEDKEVGGLLVDCTLGAKNTGLAVSILEKLASERGISFERGALAHLVERAGADITLLDGEMEKCSLRAGGDPISRAVIDDMVQRAPQESVFDLTDALGERKGARAMQLAHDLLANGQPAEVLLALMVRHFRQLLQARALLDARLPLDGSAAGRLSPEQAAQFPQADGLPNALRSQSWLGRRLSAQARNFTVEQLTRALEECLKADLALKGVEGDGGADTPKHPELVVEMLLARLV
jgi:DNA polymerase-3 subunit delta